MKKKKLGKDEKELVIDENIFEKLLTRATKQLPFLPKKSESSVAKG